MDGIIIDSIFLWFGCLLILLIIFLAIFAKFIVKEDKEWYKNPFWGPLIIAIIGGYLALAGQFAAIYFPLYYGADLSDYSVLCTPQSHEIELSEPMMYPFITGPCSIEGTCYDYVINNSVRYCYYLFKSNLSAIDLHPYYKYKHQISLFPTCPQGFDAIVKDSFFSVGQTVEIEIKANLTYILSRYGYTNNAKYPIIIESIGADGKKRNSTIMIELKPLEGHIYSYESLPRDTIESPWAYTYTWERIGEQIHRRRVGERMSTTVELVGQETFTVIPLKLGSNWEFFKFLSINNGSLVLAPLDGVNRLNLSSLIYLANQNNSSINIGEERFWLDPRNDGIIWLIPVNKSLNTTKFHSSFVSSI